MSRKKCQVADIISETNILPGVGCVIINVLTSV